MKIILLILIVAHLTSCSKPKTVLICGDHVCVNKAEAQQYFEENLTLEVKVINKKIYNKADLVELNLREDIGGEKNISISSKNKTSKKIKELSNEEVVKIKRNLKKKKTKIKKKEKTLEAKKVKKRELKKNKNKLNINNVNKMKGEVVDVCTILKKCNIDEISKYLLKEGKKKSFPDITTRQ